MSEPRPHPSQTELVLSPHYHSAVNAITQPDRMVFVSGYLVERWLPELGGDGLAILVFLRKKCYYNRRTGEKRDKVTVALSDIARGCALSVNTTRRQLQNNMALQSFISWREEYVFEEKRGGVIQTGNTYTVSMDDPLHPADLPRLAEEMQRRETDMVGAEDPKLRARQTAAQRRQESVVPPVAPSQNERESVVPPATPSQNGSPLPHPAPSQNGRALREEQRTPILGGESLDYFGLLQDIQTTQQQQDRSQENVVAFPASLIANMVKTGVTKVVAERLIERHGPAAVQQQWEWLSYRKCSDRAATLVRAIQEAWAPPAAAAKSLPRAKVRVEAQNPAVAAGAVAAEDLAVMREALTAARRKVRRGASHGGAESE